MSKPILEQNDRFGQRLTLHLEMENGELFDANKYLRGLVKTQSLEAWNGRPEEFQKWIASQLANFAESQLKVRIWGHSTQPLKLFRLVWSPEGKEIDRVKARTIAEAKKQTPMPYRRFMGEVYAEEVQP